MQFHVEMVLTSPLRISERVIQNCHCVLDAPYLILNLGEQHRAKRQRKTNALLTEQRRRGAA
jgi:hypothetical protein